MKPIYKYAICIAIGALIAFFFMKSCDVKHTTTLMTPKVVRQFDTLTVFKQLPQKNTYRYITKTDTIETENPLNQRYFDKWKEAEGRFEVRDSLYFDAISEREYKPVFEDSLVKIEEYIKVQGNLLAQAPKYTLKPRPINCPETRFRLLGGLEAGDTKTLDDFAAKASLGFQNRKGMILRVGYDTKERIWVGVDLPILTIKR